MLLEIDCLKMYVQFENNLPFENNYNMIFLFIYLIFAARTIQFLTRTIVWRQSISTDRGSFGEDRVSTKEPKRVDHDTKRNLFIKHQCIRDKTCKCSIKTCILCFKYFILFLNFDRTHVIYITKLTTKKVNWVP